MGTIGVRRLMVAAALGLAVAAAVACSSGKNNKATTTSQPSQTPTRTATGPLTGSPTPAVRAGVPTLPPGVATYPANSYMAQIQQNGKLRVGVNFNAPPMSSLNQAKNTPEGFEVDIAHQVAKAILGDETRVDFIDTNARNREAFTSSGPLDMVISAYPITDQSKTKVDFSNPYYVAGDGILVRKDTTTVANVQDLNGKKVCVLDGTTAADDLKQAAPQATATSMSTIAGCDNALIAKSVDAIVALDDQLMTLTFSDANTKLIGAPFTKLPYGIAVAKGHADFVQFLNDQLAAMIKDGRWKASYTQWLAPHTPVSADDALQRLQ